MRIVDDQIRLLPATAADTNFARAVHHLALREVVVRQFGAWDEALQDGYFARSGFPAGFEIIEYEGSRCGYLRIESTTKHVDVQNLYLHPDYQRRGIGTRLLTLAITQAASSQLPVHLSRRPLPAPRLRDRRPNRHPLPDAPRSVPKHLKRLIAVAVSRVGERFQSRLSEAEGVRIDGASVPPKRWQDGN